MNKIIILLFLLLIVINRTSYSQSDYKISANGYTFESYNDHEVSLKIYLSSYSLGSVTEWDGDLSGFVLSSERGQKVFPLKEFIPVINEKNTGTKPAVFTLIYLVPKNADYIVLKLPDKYNNLNIKIYDKSYNAQNQITEKKNTIGKIENYLGLYFAIPYQAENVNSVNLKKSVNHLGIGIGILPILQKFGKSNHTILFAELKAEFNFALAYKLSDFSNLYNTNANGYQVSERYQDSSDSKNFIYSFGLGVSHNLGFIKPMLTVSAAFLDLKFNDITVHDQVNEQKFFPGYTAWGYRIDIGFNIPVSTLYFGYSFSRFNPKTNIDFLNKPVIYNSIQFGVKGFGI